jgi:hypothetical protein
MLATIRHETSIGSPEAAGPQVERPAMLRVSAISFWSTIGSGVIRSVSAGKRRGVPAIGQHLRRTR